MRKLLGEERREAIIAWLKETDEPISGSEIAKRTNVSRQVIVQDVSLLKAMNQPIMATPQGYILIDEKKSKRNRRVIACRHTREETEAELNILVDHGVSVIDVIVEHPIYGEITGSLHLNSRFDVGKFVRKLMTTSASLLSGLTDGLHLHTIEADSKEQLEKAISELDEAGFLVH
ncbi:transcription repressor NadR [Listeria ilorinensis]|uniref:transcription repressor NadR n=1 Tax=Listeria ilorinensis TaxID=2867439 RepID=UPI001EF4280F|nr:transcription repressor NadR [Listeria ilorinensis]